MWKVRDLPGKVAAGARVGCLDMCERGAQKVPTEN